MNRAWLGFFFGLGVLAAALLLWRACQSAQTEWSETPQANDHYELHDEISLEQKTEGPSQVKIRPGPMAAQHPGQVKSIVPGGENTWPSAGDELDWDQLDTVRVLDNGMLEVPFEEVRGQKVIFGDVLLPEEVPVRQWKNRPRAQLPVTQLWPGGRIAYVISPELVPELARKVEEAMAQLALDTPVEFVERRQQEADYVEFTAGEEHCYSHVGMIGGKQKVSLSAKCDHQEILHELLHTVGLFHEHMRPDRDEHLLINWGNIDEKHWIQFKKLPQLPGLKELGEFDWQSLMLYDSGAFAKNAGQPTMLKKDGSLFTVTKNGLSAGDVERVNMMYAP